MDRKSAYTSTENRGRSVLFQASGLKRMPCQIKHELLNQHRMLIPSRILKIRKTRTTAYTRSQTKW